VNVFCDKALQVSLYITYKYKDNNKANGSTRCSSYNPKTTATPGCDRLIRYNNERRSKERNGASLSIANQTEQANPRADEKKVEVGQPQMELA